MPVLEWGPREPACDVQALTIADWLQQRMPDHTVLLFGSRARGDHSPHSDIDLVVLGDFPITMAEPIRSGMQDVARRLYGPGVDANCLPYSWDAFLAARDSPSHLAGAVQRDGLNPDGRHVQPMPQNNPWPGIQERLRTAQDALYDSLFSLAQDRLGRALEQAHQALENCLKALYAVHRDIPPHTHKPEKLGQVVRECEPALELPPNTWLTALTEFREVHPYHRDFELGSGKTELSVSPRHMVEEVQALCGRLAAATLQHMDKAPRDVRYPRWVADAPLGGLEHLEPESLDRYREGRQEGRPEGRREGAIEERQAMLRQFAEMLLTSPSVRDRVLLQLERDPPDRWPDSEDIVRLSQAPPDPDDWDFTPRGSGRVP